MIYTSNLTITGVLKDIPALYANTLYSANTSNIHVSSDLSVDGTVATTKHMDLGETIFATFRTTADIPFDGATEVKPSSSNLSIDFQASDLSAMTASNIPMVIPSYQIFNGATGIITIPTTGLYALSMQGSFSNDAAAVNPVNGVYFKMLNHGHSNARIAPAFTSGPVASTSTMQFMMGNDTVEAIFYSSDSNAQVLSANGESFISFMVMGTVSPTHSNYYRV